MVTFGIINFVFIRICQLVIKSFLEMAMASFLPLRRFLRTCYLLFSSMCLSEVLTSREI